MGSKKIDKKKLEELLKQNVQLRKDLEEMGITVNNLELVNEMSDEAQRALLRANYARLTQGGIIIVPVECGAGQHWDEAKGKCVENTIPIPEPHPEAGKDVNGITKIYKDKEGGVFINSDKFTEDNFWRNYRTGGGEQSYENEFKSDVKLDNIEVTFYVKINDFKKDNDTISIKTKGPDHSDGAGKAWYINQIMTDGSDKMTFQIESPHPNNHDNHIKPFFGIDHSLVGQWIGIKAISYLIDGGSDASIETWVDFPVADITKPDNKWRKYIDIPSAKALDHGFVKPTGGNVLLRIDGVIKGKKMPEVKYQSLREILPEGNVPTIPPVEPPTEPPVPQPPTEPPTTGNVLYDATIGKWNKTATIDSYDKDFPQPFVGGLGMEAHASGNPVFKFDGTGVGTLEAGPGHGRMYIDVNNNGSVFEYELRFNDTNIENHTCQLRSRHQEGDPPENRQGGDSFKIDLKTVGLKLEKFHNEHISGEEKPHGLPLKVGEWIKVKLTDKPDYVKGEIYQSIELNGQKVIEGTQKNLPPYLLKKEDYDKRSYLWIRVNNTKKGSVSFRNPKLTSL